MGLDGPGLSSQAGPERERQEGQWQVILSSILSLSLTNMKPFLKKKKILGRPSGGQAGKAHGRRMRWQHAGWRQNLVLLACPSVVSLGTCHPRLVPGPTYVDSADVVVTPNPLAVTVLVALLGFSAVTAPRPLAGHTPAPQSFLRLSELHRHWARKKADGAGRERPTWGTRGSPGCQ